MYIYRSMPCINSYIYIISCTWCTEANGNVRLESLQRVVCVYPYKRLIPDGTVDTHTHIRTHMRVYICPYTYMCLSGKGN